MSTPIPKHWIAKVTIAWGVTHWFVEATDWKGETIAYAGLDSLEAALRWAREMIPYLPEPGSV